MPVADARLHAPLNWLFGALAIFAVALTIYSCLAFYTFLPTSDTWIYTDFLARASQGQLDTADLFAKHNDVHVIVLPKLVYFLDMWLMQGSGALVTTVSLLAMLATTAIFLSVVARMDALGQSEKILSGGFSIIVLMSACQVESLLNPANLQWSLLVFSAVVTAWFIYRAAHQKSLTNIAGIIFGMTLAALTSASMLLVLVPFVLLVVGKKMAIRLVFAMLMLAILAIFIGEAFFFDYASLMPVLFKNWLKFTIDFLMPPVERLRSLPATLVAAASLLVALIFLARSNNALPGRESVFFGFLFWFSLFAIFATSVLRSYSGVGFTFRFVNIGLLFAAALYPLLLLQARELARARQLIMVFMFVYAGLLTFVNIKEVSVFGFGRNHTRLTQVAHALDINDSFVVASMPGTIWEKDDFEYIQAHKHVLRDAHTGIYASKEYQYVGQSIDALGSLTSVSCKTTIMKMRRLQPGLASWRLVGETSDRSGQPFSHAFFVDSHRVIRGFAIPMVLGKMAPGEILLAKLFADEPWGGFFNLEAINTATSTLAANPVEQLTIYAYREQSGEICEGENISLPGYRDLRKKSAKSDNPAEED